MKRLQPQSWNHAALELLKRATPFWLMAILALVALVGCGDDTTILTDCLGQPPSQLCPSSPTATAQPTTTPTRTRPEIPTLTAPIVLCYEVSGSPCPTKTPTPDHQPARTTISGLHGRPDIRGGVSDVDAELGARGRDGTAEQAAAADAGHVGIPPTGGRASWPARLSASVRLFVSERETFIPRVQTEQG